MIVEVTEVNTNTQRISGLLLLFFSFTFAFYSFLLFYQKYIYSPHYALSYKHINKPEKAIKRVLSQTNIKEFSSQLITTIFVSLPLVANQFRSLLLQSYPGKSLTIITQPR